ncbi:MAG: hypothetical protein U0P45_02290 [Acidimicrobiales bacterium]
MLAELVVEDLDLPDRGVVAVDEGLGALQRAQLHALDVELGERVAAAGGPGVDPVDHHLDRGAAPGVGVVLDGAADVEVQEPGRAGVVVDRDLVDHGVVEVVELEVLPDAGGGDRQRLERLDAGVAPDQGGGEQAVGADVGADVEEAVARAQVPLEERHLVPVVAGREVEDVRGRPAIWVAAEDEPLVGDVDRLAHHALADLPADGAGEGPDLVVGVRRVVGDLVSDLADVVPRRVLALHGPLGIEPPRLDGWCGDGTRTLYDRFPPQPPCRWAGEGRRRP